MITLITGGIKSGKSAYALNQINLLPEFSNDTGIFIATADSTDKSLEAKIRKHQKEREGLPLVTIEEKLDIPKVLKNIQPEIKFIIMDCITLWVSNLMFFIPDDDQRKAIYADFLSSLEFLKKTKRTTYIVTNEVGLGIIPENKLARMYQAELGRTNQRTATIADKVVLMVSGLPVIIK